MDVYNIDRMGYPDAPDEFADDTNDRHFVPAPCQAACPVGTDAPSYIGYIWEGKFAEAFEAITATNPFSSICGRVCDAPCEPACRRADSDGPLMIRNLKRFVMDKMADQVRPEAIPVSRGESIGIVGAGPAGLTAAHELSVAGFEVHVYEMTERPGGMMVWGIPAFRMPAEVVQQDLHRLMARCPGLDIHLNTALGRDITLAQLKQRHEAVLLSIGSWWGKKMHIPGEDDSRVVDGVGFLRRVNGGERPQLPHTVLVIGGGDVAMDACRVALRLPGCERVKVVYRRAAHEIPARKIELQGAIAEGIEFVYNTQPVAVIDPAGGFALRCLKTRAGQPDADGRCHPEVVTGSEHTIECGMVIAAVGQQAECDELARQGLMGKDRVNAAFDSMRTSDPQVFAAGDGAFGGSTIVMAMHHGQKAAYYIKAFLDGREHPLPYRTPYRTRRVPVAQDIMWEKLAPHEADFFGVGKNPVEFPEIEATYDWQTARQEAARCYRCDAETGSADYAVTHREDIFSMARTTPFDVNKNRKMLERRLISRENPFPAERPATFDDIVFLPANLSRLVIDPYREACKVSIELAGKLNLDHPFIVAGLDQLPEEVRVGLGQGLVDMATPYIGTERPAAEVSWLQWLRDGNLQPDNTACGHIYRYGCHQQARRLNNTTVLGLSITGSRDLEPAIAFALEQGYDMLLLDGTSGLEKPWAELEGAPDMTIVRDAVRILRGLKREGHIELVYFGGVRSGTDGAKLIGMGCTAVVVGLPVALAMGGKIQGDQLEFACDYTDEDRRQGVANIIKSAIGEASMMARCTGKTKLHSLEPEDMRSITLPTSQASGLLLIGTH